MDYRLFRLWLAADNLIILLRINSSGLIVIVNFPALISKLIGLMFGIVPAVQMAFKVSTEYVQTQRITPGVGTKSLKI